MISAVTVIFILSEGLIFLSGERLALFFMNLSAVYIILMLKEYRFYRLCTYLVSLLLIILMFNLFPSTKVRIIDQTLNDLISVSPQNENNNSYNKMYIFSKPHNDMYTSAYRVFWTINFLG